jgi:negative regulator of genetic competence, sporulation and motility
MSDADDLWLGSDVPEEAFNDLLDEEDLDEAFHEHFDDLLEDQ